jgi:tetratricopeptide (TPR) repeat protein
LKIKNCKLKIEKLGVLSALKKKIMIGDMTASQKPPSHFPKIPRFITESLFSRKTFFLLKYVSVGAVSGALLIAIALQGYDLHANAQQVKRATQDREQVMHEVVYWKQIADTYSGYRDIYYRIATLQYKLGNVDESKAYIKKALELDPNFEDARVLGTKIESASHSK